ncbi:hypothetical protein [Streptomyces sp. CA-106110]|uniref:hypothetical protein n=1 Tax=Streptomyces sp. CA-106110 TaxID=3240044 RepID=UPI003D904F10
MAGCQPVEQFCGLVGVAAQAGEDVGLVVALGGGVRGEHECRGRPIAGERTVEGGQEAGGGQGVALCLRGRQRALRPERRTRRKGLAELAQHQLVSVRRRSLHQGLFEDHFRTRNVYEFEPEDLGGTRPRALLALDVLVILLVPAGGGAVG